VPQTTKGRYRQPIRTVIYELKDPTGQVVAEHLRREYADSTKSFTWQRNGKSGLGGVLVKDLPLFGIEDLAGAAPAATVVVTEGEKARQSLKGRGILAVATVCGAKTVPDDAQLRPLVAYSPVLWADNDDDGRKHMERIAARLVGLGATPKMVNWPDAQPKGDAADCPGDAAALAKLLASATSYVPMPPNVNGHRPTTRQNPSDTEHLTDLGLAQRLVAFHGANLRYCWLWGKWMIWTGVRWESDDSGIVAAWTKDAVKTIYADTQAHFATATAAATRGDEITQSNAKKKADALYAWGLRSEAAARISAAIDLARSEPNIPVTPDMLDVNPWLLNVQNGTIDLKTGQLRPHRREDMLTKLAPVNFAPDARLPLWERFLSEAIPVLDTLAYVQRCVGATVVGKAINDLLLIVFGPGGTGKGTFLNSLLKALGDYGAAADLSTFTTSRDAHAPQPDLARLRGRRMVAISEVNEGGALAILKRATGGDVIVTRSHHQESFEFIAQFTLWIITDRRPHVPDDDTGAWRRIREIPFTVKFAKPDESIRETLTDPNIAGPAILAWAVRGCLAWQQEGVGDLPEQVIRATEAYRLDMDPLQEWLEDCCLTGETFWSPFAVLWKSYRTWATDNRVLYPLGRKGFSQRLENRFAREKHGDRGFAGLGLKTGAQIQADTSEVSARHEGSGFSHSDSLMWEKPENKCPQVSAQLETVAGCEVSAKAGASVRQVSAEVSANSPCQCLVPEHFAEGEPTPGRCPTCGNSLRCRACGGCIPCGRAVGQQGELGGLPGCPSETESPLMLQSEP
jgi:putative DNA primase/helicase